MKKYSTQKYLLSGTSALAVTAISAVALPSQAFAATVTITAATTTQQVFANNNDILEVTGAGNVSTNTGNAVFNTDKTGTKITVNTTATNTGLITTGAAAAVIATGTATITDITVTKGTIQGAGTATGTAALTLTGAAGAINVTTGADGSIVNNGTDGTALYVGTGTLNLNNAGSITATTGNGTAIRIGAGAGGTFSATNTGSITASGTGSAILVENGATGKVVQQSGTITGTVTLGDQAASQLDVNGGTIKGNVNLGNAAQNLNLAGGQINGNINGAGIVNVKADYVASGNIGATTAVTKVAITDGKTLNLATNNGVLKTTGGVTVGSGTTGATLTLGTGTIDTTIDANTDGKGTLNFNGSNTTKGAIGNTAGFAAINLADGVTIDAATNNNTLKATAINLGGANGATLTLGTGAVTGTITSTVAGKGTLNFNGSQTNAAAIGGSSALAAVNVANGATVNMNANVNATTVKVGSGASGVLDLKAGKTITGAVNINNGGTFKQDVSATVSGLVNGTAAATGTYSIIGNGTFTSNNNIGGTNSLAAFTTGDDVKASLGHNINATTITIGGGTSGIATQTAGLITGNVAIANGATLALVSGSGITGNVAGAADNVGTLNVNNTYTSTGTIGTNANTINALNINTGGTLNLGGNVDATAINVNGTGVLNFGTTARTMVGNLTGAATATMNLGNKTHTLTGDLATAGTNTIQTTLVDGAGAAGRLNGTNVTYAAGTTISVDTTKATGFIATGTKYIVVTGTGAHTNAGVVTDNSAVLTFAEDLTVANQRIVTATRANTYQGIATDQNAKNIGTVLTTLAGTATNELATFQGRLDGAANAQQMNAIIEEATPQIQSASIQATQSVGQSIDQVGSRLSNLRAGIDNSITGMAAGGAVADRALWIQGFGMTADQSRREGVGGFDADTYGVAVGADTVVAANTRAGASISYGNTELDSQEASASKNTDIDSYQVNLYGTHEMGKLYVDGLVGYAWQRYESSRVITAPASIARADYDGHTYTLRANTGYRLDAGNGVQLIPNTGLTYFNNQVDGYTETGAGGLNIRMGDTDSQSLFGRIGLDIAKEYQTASGMLVRPVVRAAYLYDFLADEAETSALFTGGGATFRVADAEPDRNSFNLGASLNIANSGRVSFSADYDFLTREDYDAHSGMLRARFGF